MTRSQELEVLIRIKKQSKGLLLQKYAQPIQTIKNLQEQISEYTTELKRIKDCELPDFEIKL